MLTRKPELVFKLTMAEVLAIVSKELAKEHSLVGKYLVGGEYERYKGGDEGMLVLTFMEKGK